MPEASPNDTTTESTNNAGNDTPNNTRNEEAKSEHAKIAHDLIHLRSAVGSPTLSPSGERVAMVVATVDLDENTTRTSIWLDGVPLLSLIHI